MRRRAVQSFIGTETVGGLLLLAATAAALVWANSPFQDGYRALSGFDVPHTLGSLTLPHDLGHWVNDGLMALFFFVVGLEIKRELVAGELSDVRKAALPALAAFGGMVLPALIYAVINAGGPGGHGWGIPMATDIAFAVGLLALLEGRIPAGLKVFVLTLAVVDDIGAIVVIAIFYSSGLDLGWLFAAAGVLAVMGFLLRRRPGSLIWCVLPAIAVWLFIFQSGVHATIAGVALGLLFPARPDRPDGTSVASRVGSAFHPWTSFLVVPLFALANAGISLSADGLGAALSSRITWGVVAGLVGGKVIGVSAMSWGASRLGVGAAPEGVRGVHLLGASAVAGIGFTVSLFITGLAFADPGAVSQAKIGVFSASLVAGAAGALILMRGPDRVAPESLRD